MQDYRLSHVEKGPVYDTRLSQEPWSAYMTEHEHRLVRSIVRAHYPAGIPRYLDFACGTGRMTSVVEPMAAASYGIDVSPSMVETARRKCPDTTFLVRDITKDRPDIDPVDVVTSFRFFGNAQDELRLAALAAIRTCLVAGGRLIINNHRNPWSVQDVLRRLTGGAEEMDFSYGKMRRMLTESGFRIERTYGIGWWLLRSGLNTAQAFDSRLAAMLEPVSRLPFVVPICPDMVVVARKS